jgi:hypothetical protein
MPWAPVAGQVARMLGILKAELSVTMVLTGCNRAADAGRELLLPGFEPRSHVQVLHQLYRRIESRALILVIGAAGALWAFFSLADEMAEAAPGPSTATSCWPCATRPTRPSLSGCTACRRRCAT